MHRWVLISILIYTFEELLEALASASTDAEKAIIKEAYDDFRKTLTKEPFGQLFEKKTPKLASN